MYFSTQFSFSTHVIHHPTEILHFFMVVRKIM